MQARCSKCSRPIALADVIESSGGRLSHLNCARSQGLSPEERALLLMYCSDHLAAQCQSCNVGFRMMELAVDPLGDQTTPCPRCHKDLTQNLRAHLFSCVALPSEIQHRTQEVRDAAMILVKQSQQALDKAELQIREAEAHLFERQQALRAAMVKRADHHK